MTQPFQFFIFVDPNNWIIDTDFFLIIKNIIKIVNWTSRCIKFSKQVIVVIYRFWFWYWPHFFFLNWSNFFATSSIIYLFTFTHFIKFIIILYPSWSFRICCCVFLFVLNFCTIFIFVDKFCLFLFNQITSVVIFNFIINIRSFFCYLFQGILVSFFFVFCNISVNYTFIFCSLQFFVYHHRLHHLHIPIYQMGLCHLGILPLPYSRYSDLFNF